MRRDADWPLLVALGLCLLCLVSPTARIDPSPNPRRRMAPDSDWPAEPEPEPWAGGDDWSEEDDPVVWADPGLLSREHPCPVCGGPGVIRWRDCAVWCRAGCDRAYLPRFDVWVAQLPEKPEEGDDFTRNEAA